MTRPGRCGYGQSMVGLDAEDVYDSACACLEPTFTTLDLRVRSVDVTGLERPVREEQQVVVPCEVSSSPL